MDTVRPLATNPAVQTFVATRVTNRLFSQVDVTAYVQEVLPDRAQPLAGPLTAALKTFTYQATLRVLQSDQFETFWVDANRLQHRALVRLLTGSKNPAVSQSSNGEITIDLNQVAEQVKTRLESTGISVFSKIPTDKVSGSITVFKAEGLYKARHALKVLDKLALVMPFVVFACFGGAILLSRNRRRGFIAAAIAFTLGAVILAIGLATGRSFYLDAVTNGGLLPRDAAAAFYDTLLRLLHTSLRAVLTFSIVVVIAAVFAGPSRLAVWFRDRVRHAAAWLGGESDRAGWGWLGASSFFVRHKGAMRIVVAVVGFVTLFFWNRPTPMVIFWIAVAALVLLAIIEFFGREPEISLVATSAQHGDPA